MSRTQQGGMLAIAAFAIWGAFPFYFKTVAHLSPLEVLANRIIWAAVCLLFLLFFIKEYWQVVANTLVDKKQIFYLLLSTIFIATNWGVYIWAVTSEQLFEASLGYYINPLLNVFLGFVILKENLNRLQWFAVLLAVIGVSLQIAVLGKVPWIALLLAFSFGLYGLIHKKIAVESVPGLFIEAYLLLPVALFYLAWLMMGENSEKLGPLSWSQADWWLLMAAGPVTVVPLLLFTAAAKRINYSSLGFFQYITPSMLFLLALFFYQEPFSPMTLLTFLFIWSALSIFSFDVLRRQSYKG